MQTIWILSRGEYEPDILGYYTERDHAVTSLLSLLTHLPDYHPQVTNITWLSERELPGDPDANYIATEKVPISGPNDSPNEMSLACKVRGTYCEDFTSDDPEEMMIEDYTEVYYIDSDILRDAPHVNDRF